MDPPALFPNASIAEPAALPDRLQQAILVPFPTMDPLAEPPDGLLPAIPASPPVGSLEFNFENFFKINQIDSCFKMMFGLVI